MFRRKKKCKYKRFFSLTTLVILIFSMLIIDAYTYLPSAQATTVNHDVGELKVNMLSDFGRILRPLQWPSGGNLHTVGNGGWGYIGLVVDQANYDHTSGSIDIADCYALASNDYWGQDDFGIISPIDTIIDDGNSQKSIATFKNIGTSQDANDILINQSAWTVKDKDWAILQWRVINIKSPVADITDFCLGLEVDISQEGAGYGLGGDSGDDTDGFNTTENVYWAQDDGGTGTCLGFGSAIASDPITHYFSRDYHPADYNEYKTYWENETWLYDRIRAPNSVEGGSPGNRTSTIGWNSVTIPIGSSWTFTLVIAINSTYDEMITAIKDARYYYKTAANGYRITEFSDSDSSLPQIEVYNDGLEPTNVATFSFTVDGGSSWLTGSWNKDPIPTYEYGIFSVTGGTIGKEGDTIGLYKDGALVDEIAFGQEGTAPDPLKGESVARRFDDNLICYSDDWLRNASSGPTWGNKNNVRFINSSSILILNEIMFNPNTQVEGFVELYLKGGSLDISGYKIVGDTVYIIPDGIVLMSSEPYFYLTYEMNTTFFDALESSGDNIYLYKNTGDLLDMAGWSSQHIQGKTMSRVPNGNGTSDGFDDTTSIKAGWFFDCTPTVEIVTLSARGIIKYGSLGDTKYFNLTITNRQTVDDAVLLFNSTLNGYDVVILDETRTFEITKIYTPSGSSVYIWIAITIPSSIPYIEWDNITITISSENITCAKNGVALQVWVIRPVADAGEDQVVFEGDEVQFIGRGSSGIINVLHVSVGQHDELQMMIDYTGSTDNFSVTQVGLFGFNTGTPNDLSSYDAIVFGLNNGFEMNSVPIARTKELEEYVFNGGGIVWTHDSLEYTWDYGPNIEVPAGVDCDLNSTSVVGLDIPNAEIIMDHEILHNLFEIGNVGDLIPKTPYPPPWFHYTHTDQSYVTTADIVIEHDTLPLPGLINFYLTTEEYGQGRVALDVIGHTVASEDGTFLGLPSLKECQILVNAVYWVAKGEKKPIITSYSWDLDANVDSNGDGNNTNDTDATGPTPTHVYGDDGIYTVTLTVTDGKGLSDADTMQVTVNNLAPTIEPFGPFNVEEGFPFSFVANATDSGSDDLTFTWSWGDGTTNTTTIHYNDGIGPDPYPSPWGDSPFNTSDLVQHIYDTEGVYTINLTVEDDDGGATVYKTNVTVIGIAPPTLYINVSQDKRDVILYWDLPSTLGIDHYLIYRSTSQIDFDFSTPWINTSRDNESGEPGPIPLRTMWNDTNAALFGNDNYEEQYYYTMKAVNIFGKTSTTSRTVGKWTKSFPQGVSTFSLPLEPLETVSATADLFLKGMNAIYIKWMNPTSHIWMRHGAGVTNDTQMKLGECYEVLFNIETVYTFTGMPGAMISHKDSKGFQGFDSYTEAKGLKVIVKSNGDVNLSWQKPVSMTDGWYEVYFSYKRDGFFKTIDEDYFLACPIINYGTNTTTITGIGAHIAGTRLYYLVVPFNASGIRGSSTYSVGIWTEEYLSGYDTIGIPLKLNDNQTADWYCDNIPFTVGINYHNDSKQRWYWHSTIMPAGAFDTTLKMTDGYQISTTSITKFIFIGV
ncbi:MAG: PKD domain-containing protein [Thermoplasmata archaeon]|nr:MAG: PKD domain-containing protein [Thermoplasmata archaeon]